MGETLVKCHCCDTPFMVPIEVLQRARVPGTYCRRCYDEFDLLTLRKWYMLDRLYQQVQLMAEDLAVLTAK